MGMNLNGDSFDTGNGVTKTITTAVFNRNVWLIVYKGTTVNNLTFYPMLIKSTEDKPYEQYGASPSIDYPSEIKTVGSNVNLIPTDETDWEQGTIDSGTPEYSTTRIRTADYCPIKYYEQTISLVNSDSYVFRNIHYYDSNKTYINNQFELDGNKHETFTKLTFTPPATAMYFKAVISKKDNSALTPNKIRDIKPKLEKGTMATLWSPHNQGSVEIDVVNKNFFDKNKALRGYELNGKTGQTSSNSLFFTSDYIRVNPNEQYFLSGKHDGFSNCFYDKNKKILAKVTLANGLLTVPDNSDIYYLRFNARLTSIDTTMIEKGTEKTDYVEGKSKSAIMPIQQEMLTGDYIDDVEHHEWGKIESYNGEIITTDYISTTGELTTGATVYYKLAEPIDLELTSEQKAIREQKLYTYKNITNISLSDELASIDVTYKKDLETMFNNIIKQIPSSTSDTTET